MRTRPVVGILGGMGPAATAAFYTRLVGLTPARRDQEHLHVVMWADPTVPDRTAALLGHGKSVVPWLERGISALRACGADAVVSPCNTVHAWLPGVSERIGVELISIIDATVEAVASLAPPGSGIGIFGTDATLASRLYQNALRARGLKPLVPAPQLQGLLMRAVYQVKVGDTAALDDAADLVTEVGEHLISSGAGVILSGCTELSLVLDSLAPGIPAVDSSDALARAVVGRFA